MVWIDKNNDHFCIYRKCWFATTGCAWDKDGALKISRADPTVFINQTAMRSERLRAYMTIISELTLHMWIYHASQLNYFSLMHLDHLWPHVRLIELNSQQHFFVTLIEFFAVDQPTNLQAKTIVRYFEITWYFIHQSLYGYSYSQLFIGICEM